MTCHENDAFPSWHKGDNERLETIYVEMAKQIFLDVVGFSYILVLILFQVCTDSSHCQNTVSQPCFLQGQLF